MNPKQDESSTGQRDRKCHHQMLKKNSIMHGLLESCILRKLPRFSRIFEMQYLRNEAILEKSIRYNNRPLYEE